MGSSVTALYVQFGAGNEAIPGWLNFDSSPTLRIQKVPILGSALRPRLNCVFDEEILYGDIVKGLPLRDDSVTGLFCSHVLEHLSKTDFSTALSNSFRYLIPGGRFRIIVPDLRAITNAYHEAISRGNPQDRALAAVVFCKSTHLGYEPTRSTVMSRLKRAFSNSHHEWMWDEDSLTQALIDHGFINIRRFHFGSSDDEMFLRPERAYQFDRGLALECVKPVISVSQT